MAEQDAREWAPNDEPSDGCADPNTLVPGRAERAPPPKPDRAPSSPTEVAPGVLWVPRTPKPVMLPPERSLLAYILSDKEVWRRCMASMVVVTLLVVCALKFLGVNFVIVGVTSTATVLGIAISAYLGRRKDTKQPHSGPEPSATSSDRATSCRTIQEDGPSA